MKAKELKKLLQSVDDDAIVTFVVDYHEYDINRAYYDIVMQSLMLTDKEVMVK